MSPAGVGDPLNQPAQVAHAVAGIVHRHLFVAQFERAEEYLPFRIVGKDQSPAALRSGQLGQARTPLFGGAPAAEPVIGAVAERPRKGAAPDRTPAIFT